MGQTPSGLPYPEPSDPIAEGASAIRALAEGVQGGTYPAFALAGNTTSPTRTVSFDPPYSAPPHVVVAVGGVYWSGAVVDVTATGFTFQCRNNGGASQTLPVQWLAVG